MPWITVVTGLLLTGLGLWGYYGTGTQSPTPLIPAFVGVPLVLLGLLALKESLLKHAMHAAAMIGLLGFLGGVGRVVQVLVSKGSLPSGDAGISVTAMIVLCGVFEALCVNSFVAARRRRRAQAGQATASLP